MRNPPMFLHAVDSSTYICAPAFIPFTFQSIIPRCYTVDYVVHEPRRFEIARELYDSWPLLHFFCYHHGLLPGYAMLFVPQMAFNLRRPYCVSTRLAYHDLPFTIVTEKFARHGILFDSLISFTQQRLRQRQIFLVLLDLTVPFYICTIVLLIDDLFYFDVAPFGWV